MKKICVVLVLSVSLAACGGRLPSANTSKAMIRKHFNKYGKEYKTSPFGGKKVTSVEILKTDEIHKNLVAVQSFVTIEGPEVFKVRMVIEKGPFGWRYISWENLSGL